jgi:hypothetical protein
MRVRTGTLRSLVVTALAIAPTLLFPSHKVVSPTSSVSNDKVEISATITLDQTEVAKKLGSDPGKGVVLVEVRLSPKTDQGMRVSPDDFYILSHDDGQRSQPFSPEQFAGKGGLSVGQGPGTAGGLGVSRPGIPIGTTPGGTMRRLPGNGAGVGNSADAPGGMKTETNDKDQGNSDLLKALKAKQLPDTTANDEVSGYLYFPLAGKHKLKNLAILYRGQGGRLDLEFEH